VSAGLIRPAKFPELLFFIGGSDFRGILSGLMVRGDDRPRSSVLTEAVTKCPIERSSTDTECLAVIDLVEVGVVMDPVE
jgi:hypothetical protein